MRVSGCVQLTPSPQPRRAETALPLAFVDWAGRKVPSPGEHIGNKLLLPSKGGPNIRAVAEEYQNVLIPEPLRIHCSH